MEKPSYLVPSSTPGILVITGRKKEKEKRKWSETGPRDPFSLKWVISRDDVVHSLVDLVFAQSVDGWGRERTEKRWTGTVRQTTLRR